jgi:transposase
MLQPVRRRTWAPRGQTPIQYSWDRHDRLSVVSAVIVSPLRQRFGFYFRIHSHNIRFGEAMAFLRLVHRHLRRKFVLVLDRYNVHRKAVRLLKEGHADWFDPEWLPAYAPDLNPVEPAWNRTKYGNLANFIPDDVEDLYERVAASMRNTRNNRKVIRSFFEYAKLKV